MMTKTLILLILLFKLSWSMTIHEAVNADSPAQIKLAIASGADVNEIGPGGQTPLMHAVLAGKPASVKFLLEEAGADVSIGEKDGYTPMHGAGFQGRAEIARMLIAHGLDPFELHADGCVRRSTHLSFVSDLTIVEITDRRGGKYKELWAVMLVEAIVG